MRLYLLMLCLITYLTKPVTVSMAHLKHPTSQKKIVLLGDVHENDFMRRHADDEEKKTLLNINSKQTRDLNNLVDRFKDHESFTIFVTEIPLETIGTIAEQEMDLVPYPENTETMNTIPRKFLKQYAPQLCSGTCPQFIIGGAYWYPLVDPRSGLDRFLTHGCANLDNQQIDTGPSAQMTLKEVHAYVNNTLEELEHALDGNNPEALQTIKNHYNYLASIIANANQSQSIIDFVSELKGESSKIYHRYLSELVKFLSYKFDAQSLQLLNDFEQAPQKKTLIFQAGNFHAHFLKKALMRRGYQMVQEQSAHDALNVFDQEDGLTKKQLSHLIAAIDTHAIYNITASVDAFFEENSNEDQIEKNTN